MTEYVIADKTAETQESFWNVIQSLGNNICDAETGASTNLHIPHKYNPIFDSWEANGCKGSKIKAYSRFLFRSDMCYCAIFFALLKQKDYYLLEHIYILLSPYITPKYHNDFLTDNFLLSIKLKNNPSYKQWIV